MVQRTTDDGYFFGFIPVAVPVVGQHPRKILEMVGTPRCDIRPAGHHLNNDVCSAAGILAKHCAKSLIADVATRPMIVIRSYLYPIMDRIRGW